MAHNPQAPQGPQGNPDPAGSTQMFRAFVDDAEPQHRPAAQQSGGGSKVGMTVGIVIGVVVILAVVGWLAFS